MSSLNSIKILISICSKIGIEECHYYEQNIQVGSQYPNFRILKFPPLYINVQIQQCLNYIPCNSSGNLAGEAVTKQEITTDRSKSASLAILMWIQMRATILMVHSLSWPHQYWARLKWNSQNFSQPPHTNNINFELHFIPSSDIQIRNIESESNRI